VLASVGRTAKPQAQDSVSVPAAKMSIADRLKTLFGVSTGRPR
jgi:hypothetical protein